MNHREKGTTLLEVLIGAVLLALIAVPIFSLLWSSSHSVERADQNREARFLSDLILGYAENSDFVELFDNFGASFPDDKDGKNCLQGPNNDLSEGVMRGGQNVLAVDDWTRKQLTQKGWKVDLKFRFLTRNELGYGGNVHNIKPKAGVLHFQAGVIWLRLLDDHDRVIENIRKCVYCPMILGRPGLDLKQCPAVNPEIRDKKLGNYP
jgi:hypothetical protein